MAMAAVATPPRCSMAAAGTAAAAAATHGGLSLTAPLRRRRHQGHDDRELCRRRHPGIAQAAGAGRFLGAVVRSLQAADAGAGKGGPRRRRQGQAGQDEHRRPSVDRRPARHPVDSGGHRLQGRPAGRRLHGRHSREPDPRVHQKRGRQGWRSPQIAEALAAAGEAREPGTCRPPPTSIRRRAASRRPTTSTRSAGLADLLFEAGDSSRRRGTCLAEVPDDKQEHPAIAARARQDQACRRGRRARRSGRVRARGSPRIPRTIRRASTSP